VEELYDLFPLEQADVTENGLMFHGIFYSCSIAIREQWYLQTIGTLRKIPIFVDRFDSDYILVLLKDGGLTIAYKIIENTLMNEQSIESYQEIFRSLKQQLKTRKRGKNEKG
jgi:hypothetical protein